MLPLVPLTRRSVVDETFDALRARILHGHWAPGDKLPTEQALTSALGVSRSTVREALNRLASAGLVHIPHGGTKTVLDYQDHAGLEVLSALVLGPEGDIDVPIVRSVVEMRAALAPDAARLAAIRRTPAQAAELTALVRQLGSEDALEDRLLTVLDWWSCLVRSSENLAYRLAFNTLLSTATETRPVLRAILGPELLAQDRYAAITAAIAAADGPVARSQTTELVALGTDAILVALESLS